MFDASDRPAGTKPEFYAELDRQLAGLMDGERDAIANMANLSALLAWGLADLNWAGFYILRGQTLVLGPFQGRPACILIPVGKGVCGTAVAQGRPQIVPDVHAFPGHIACDASTRSELVVPLWRGEACLGVLDLDSPRPGRFDMEDADGCAALARRLVAGSEPV